MLLFVVLSSIVLILEEEEEEGNTDELSPYGSTTEQEQTTANLAESGYEDSYPPPPQQKEELGVTQSPDTAGIVESHDEVKVSDPLSDEVNSKEVTDPPNVTEQVGEILHSVCQLECSSFILAYFTPMRCKMVILRI